MPLSSTDKKFCPAALGPCQSNVGMWTKLLLLLTCCSAACGQLTSYSKLCKTLHITHQDYEDHKDAVRLRKQLNNFTAGCQYVHGDVIIRRFGIEPMSGAQLEGGIRTMDTDFFDSIVEITGQLVIDQVNLERLQFRNLRTIRGYNEKFAIQFLQLVYPMEIALPKITAVAKSDILLSGAFDATLYCRLTTSVKWTILFQTTRQKVELRVTNLFNGTQAIKLSTFSCPRDQCHSTCISNFCWSDSPAGCQADNRCKSRKCNGNLCYYDRDSSNEECCNSHCLGGCHSYNEKSCFSCRAVSYEGSCRASCPGSSYYDPGSGTLVSSKDPMVRVGDICMKQCPVPFVKDVDGHYCLAKCPVSQVAIDRNCTRCSGGEECSTCESDQRQLKDENVSELSNCTIWSFSGNTFNILGNEISLETLNAVRSVRMVYVGLLNIKQTESLVQNLSFLSQLTYVSGNLVIMKVQAQYLALANLRTTKKLAIFQVSGLCKNWYPATYLGGKAPFPVMERSVTFSDGADCAAAKCDPQCADECWGPGPGLCVECRNFSIDGVCFATCEDGGRYAFNDTLSGQIVCNECHPQCAGGCQGPAATQCQSCRHFNQGGECVSRCSAELEPDGAGNCHSVLNSRLALVAVGAVVLALILVLVVILGCLYYRKRLHKYEVVDLEEYLIDAKHSSDMAQLLVVNNDDIVKQKEIGSGAFGTVYKGSLRLQTRTGVKQLPVAVKVLHSGNPKSGQELLNEAGVLARVKHPHCIRLVGLCMTSDVQLITNLMPRGCLLDFLKSHKNRIGATRMLTWAQQVAEGMAYLEAMNIVHRDLAARNVLLSTPEDIKITDFGLAKLLDVSEQEFLHTAGVLPVKWLGLECFESGTFSHKSDVWSYGVLLWEICTYGESPYKPYSITCVDDIADILKKGVRLPQPSNCSVDFYNIMLSCWLPSPESRPTFSDLISAMKDCLLDPTKFIANRGVEYDDVGLNDDKLDDVQLRNRGIGEDYAPMSELEPEEKVSLVVRPAKANMYIPDPSTSHRVPSHVQTRRSPDVPDSAAPMAEVDDYLEPVKSSIAQLPESEYLMPRSLVTSAPVGIDDDYLAPTKC